MHDVLKIGSRAVEHEVHAPLSTSSLSMGCLSDLASKVQVVGKGNFGKEYTFKTQGAQLPV